MSSETGLILVVDDNAVNRMVLKRALEAQGHEVVTAENGLRALELLLAQRERPVDVVLLDLVMPGLDGYETLGRIKSDETLRDLPVIVISAVDDLSTAVRCIELGAADYLPKPFDPAVLKARLRASLAEKRVRQLEREHEDQIARLSEAVAALVAGKFEPAILQELASQDDAVGALARAFQGMARDLQAREEFLRREMSELESGSSEMTRPIQHEDAELGGP